MDVLSNEKILECLENGILSDVDLSDSDDEVVPVIENQIIEPSEPAPDENLEFHIDYGLRYILEQEPSNEEVMELNLDIDVRPAQETSPADEIIRIITANNSNT